MQYLLKNFEINIDEKIVKRGFDYFKSKQVGELFQTGPDTFEAEVYGTENYTVKVVLKGEWVAKFNCDCPYDLGPICKHIVAVLFTIRKQNAGEEEVQIPKKSREKKQGYEKPVYQQIEDVFAKISKTELENFIKDICKNDASFRSLFLGTFTHHLGAISKEMYIQKMKTFLKASPRDHDFIENEKIVTKPIFILLENAQKNLNENTILQTIYLCESIFEVLIPANENSINGNDEIYDTVNESFELVELVIAKYLTPEIKNELFEYCLLASRKKQEQGNDWEFAFLEVAAKLVENETDMNLLTQYLDKTSDKYYGKEKKAELKLIALKKYKGKESSDEFIHSNLQIPEFRKQVIEKEFENKNYTKIKQLAHEGISINREDHRAKKEWKEWLLKVAQIENDIPHIIEYARELFFYLPNSPDMNCLVIIKEKTFPNSWNEELEKIIARTKTFYPSDTLLKIYIMEKDWKNILLFLQNKLSFEMIEICEPYIKTDYKKELISLYELAIYEFLQNKYANLGTKQYQKCCRMLRRMKKLDAQDEVEKIIQDLREKYPKRNSLLVELNTV